MTRIQIKQTFTFTIYQIYMNRGLLLVLTLSFVFTEGLTAFLNLFNKEEQLKKNVRYKATPAYNYYIYSL